MSAARNIAARIHVLLAREAKVGVIIRRGPSKSVCTMLWDRGADRFELGQWLKGRIYERRSDLSPDGRHLIYFAMNGKWDSPTKGAWTAISRVPYLKAVALYPKGDAWGGGGLFIDDRTYWIGRGIMAYDVAMETPSLVHDSSFSPAAAYGTKPYAVYEARLVRDGWRQVSRIEESIWVTTATFDKPLNMGWVLKKEVHRGQSPAGKGYWWDKHELANGNVSVPCPDWEWADLDSGRLVWAAHGQLFTGKLRDDGLCDETLLYDFNGMTFQAIEAPY